MFGHLVSANLRFTQAWHFQFTAGGDTGAIMADSVIHSLHFNPSLNDSDQATPLICEMQLELLPWQPF